jgi:hypothetical protein
MAQRTNKDPQAEAAAGVGTAFDAAPGGLTPEQQAAFGGVQSAFTPTAPVVSPIQRTIDPGADAATKYLDTFQAPETADQIAERLRQGSQGAIDAINKVHDDQVSANNVAGQERLAQDNAISVLSGLTGSTEASRTRGAVLDKNDKETQAINNERLLKLQSLYTQISKDAEDQALKQREDATTDANSIVAQRAQAQTKTLDTLKSIAAGGLVDFDSFKNSPQNAQVYQHALDAVGGSEQALRGLFAVNRPQDQLVGTPTRVGDHFIQAYQNPLTGKVSYDTIEVPGGLPAQYSNFQKIGDNIVAIPDGWDGDISKLKTIYGGSSDGGQPGDNPQLYAGLSAKTATAVRAQVAAFKSEPAVQNFAVIQEGRNFAGSLSDTTKNPTDDQGLIYALAKAMDPGSVVREGEYATAQKYAQSLVDSYGKGVTQAINGTGFLTEKARRQIKDTIEARYKASLGSYTHLENQYQTGINNLTGRSDGAKFVRDYQTGGQEAATAPGAGSSDSDPLGLGI